MRESGNQEHGHVALGERRQWYRYHHLLGDVLRARLAEEKPDQVVDLHRRASDWFDTHGDRAEAIRHARAAEDFTKAAELVELAIPELGKARRDATLHGAWTRRLAGLGIRDPPAGTATSRLTPTGSRPSRR